MMGIFTLMGKPVNRAFTVLLLLISLLSGTPVLAQDNPVLYQEIQLDKKSYQFDELTHVIQQQTGLTFSYNASKISSSKKFRIHSKRITLVKLLKTINKESGIGYEMVQGHHIIYIPGHRKSHYQSRKKKKKSAEKKKDIATTDNALAAQTETQNAGINLASITDSGITQKVYVFGDSLTAATYYFGGGTAAGGMGTIKMVMRYPNGSGSWENPYASLNPPEGNHAKFGTTNDNPDITGFLRKNLLIGAGFTADETYYFNPTLQFGLRFLYAQVSYNFGNFSQWRYGLGINLPINDQWKISADFSTGKRFSSSSYSYPKFDTTFPPPPDSIITPPLPIITRRDVPITVQSKLNRFSISVARTFNKNLTVSAGITFNQLKSSYFSREQPLDLTTFNLPVNDALKRFITIKPAYLLTNTYNSTTATGVKTWIGIRISLLYRLNF